MQEKFIACVKNNKENIKFICEIFLFCFFTLLITSNNSFLYPTNMWDDANAFFTVGKSIRNGAVVYKDIFEQKGPLFYFIYLMGSLISANNFYGIFLLEVVFASVGIYFLYKIVRLYVVDEKRSKLISAIYWIFIITSNAFTYGGTTEEFCFPFFMITIYYFFRHLREKEIIFKELRLLGFLAGCILLIKFNLLGLWFAFMAIIFFDYLSKKEYKTAFLSCIHFLIGMSIPFFIINMYMLANDALGDFYKNYFWANMGAYASSKFIEYNYFVRVFYAFVVGLIAGGGLIGTFLFLFSPLVLYFYDGSKKEKFYFIILFLFISFTIFCGINYYMYYILPVGYLAVILVIQILEKFFKTKYGEKIEKVIYSEKIGYKFLVSAVFIIVLIFGANHKEYFLKSKEDVPLYRFAQIINEEKNPTLVNMGGLDVGLYLFANVLPTTYYFELQNYEYEKFPDIVDSFRRYISEKKTTFIVFYTKDNLWDIQHEYSNLMENYDFVAIDKYNKKYIYLFKVK